MGITAEILDLSIAEFKARSIEELEDPNVIGCSDSIKLESNAFKLYVLYKKRILPFFLN